MKTKYGELEDWRYEELLPEAENADDPGFFSFDIKLASLNHYQGDLLPWCPLFGELPENNYYSSCQITRCINIIEDARSIWGVPPIRDTTKQQLIIYDSIACDSWPEVQKVSSLCPEEDILLARNLFIEWEEISSYINNALRRPYQTDDGQDDYGIPLGDINEENLLEKLSYQAPWKTFKEIKSWHIFTILAIYEARKVLNVSLYTHVPSHYYAKAKWGSIEEKEKDFKIIQQVQLATDLLQRGKMLKLRPDIERGQKVVAAAKKSGEGRREQLKDERYPVWEAWQAEASRIWKANPSLSKSAVAMRIRQNLEKEDLSPPSCSTIRRRIFMPT